MFVSSLANCYNNITWLVLLQLSSKSTKKNKLELFIALKLSGNEIFPKYYYNKYRLVDTP